MGQAPAVKFQRTGGDTFSRAPESRPFLRKPTPFTAGMVDRQGRQTHPYFRTDPESPGKTDMRWRPINPPAAKLDGAAKRLIRLAQ